MALIGILIALLLERLLSPLPGWGRPLLFLGYARAMMRVLAWPALWRSALAPLLLLAPPLLVVAAISTNLGHPLVELGWSSLVLLLCLGPRDLAEDVQRLLAARERGDVAGAAQLAAALQRGPQPDATHRSLLGAMFIQSHERLFAVLLWFFALGPVGAVLYRCASRLPRLLREAVPNSPAMQVSELLHDACAWVPARITALLFGLAGSLDDATQVWRQLWAEPNHGWRSHTWAVLAEVSAASLRTEEADGSVVVPASLEASLGEVLRMQWRALVVLLAFFAFFATGSMF
jgi:membrane protein required for beta-lactamase induction